MSDIRKTMTRPISFLSLDHSFTFGGAINSLYHLTRSMDKSAFSPIVVSAQPPDFLQSKFSDCIHYHFHPKLPWIHNHLFLKIKSYWLFRNRILGNTLTLFRYIYWLLFFILPESVYYYKLGKKHKVSLVHLNNGPYMAGIIAAKLLRVPCVTHLRGFISPKWLDLKITRLIDHHVAISSAIRKNLLDCGVMENKISLIHNAIDIKEYIPDVSSSNLLKEFNIGDSQPVYGFFGRIVAWKGVREFILAAAIINRECPQAKGIIVGDISDGSDKYYLEIQDLIDKNGLRDTIILTGFRADIPELMAMMDVVVHSSIEPEPFGRVIIEAMAAARAVVAARFGGPLDIVVDGRTGLFIDPENTKELAEAVVKLLQNPSLCREMGQAGRQRVEQMFDTRLYAKKMEDLFFRLTESKKTA